MQSSTFKFFVPFTKAYIQKDTNKMVVEGLASTTEVDLTGEKVAESAIKSMAASNLPLSFRSEHKSDWDAELGQVVSLSATPDHQLLMKAELDADHPNAHFLFGKLQTGSRLGLSIGGKVNDWAWENDPESGRAIRTYKDIGLNEVSVTSHPAVQSTFLSAISKSLNTEEPSMPQPQAATKAVEELTPNVEPAEAVVATTPVAAIPEGSPQDPAINGEVPLNPDQPAPADQPAAAPATPATPGNHATPEQVEAIATPATEENPEEQTEQTPETEQPATPDNAGHQEAASTEATQPDAATTEKAVSKAQYLDEWTEADATAQMIGNISDNLSWRVWGVISDDTMDAPSQITAVDAMLTEFHTIILKVATVLIEQDAASDAAEMGKALKVNRQELTKSLDTTTEELASIKKQLAERTITLAEQDAAVTTAQETITATQKELAAVKATLATAEKQAEIEQARKAYAVASKFDEALNFSKKNTAQDMDKAFASFFVTGNK